MRRTIRMGAVAGFTLLGLPWCPVAAGAQSPSRPATAGDDLLGLWGSEPILGPQVRGALVLERRRASWSLRVGGFEAVGTPSGDTLLLPLPGGQGALRARLARAARGAAPTAAPGASPSRSIVDAFWVQPAGDGAPAYATPVRLVRAGPDSWRGMVTPLDARFPLYLQVLRGADGVLEGVFRNPAANWPGRAGRYGVVPEGDHVTFLEPRTKRPRYRQPYDSAAGRLTFDFGSPVVLTRRTVDQAVGFFPRSPSAPPYGYRPPADLADGWRSAHATDMGVRGDALQAIVRRLVAVDPLNDSLPRVHALLVARRGRLVLDEYFHGYAADQLHDLRSASKTVTSILVGAARARGTAIGAATPVLAGADGAPITVGHLLSHTSGLACDDDDDTSPGNEDRMQEQSEERDWYRFTRALPRLRAPGAAYAY